MALPASVAVVILLLFSAASFFVHARKRRYDKIQSSGWDNKEYEAYFKWYYLNFQVPTNPGPGKYRPYLVLLREHPNGEPTDNEDARRRWYESFLPSALTDSGEPRLLHCYPFDVNGFLARLTRAEARVMANTPGLRSMHTNQLYTYSTASCGFKTKTTANTKKSFLRSRQAF